MSRAKRRFEERKRKLRKIGTIYRTWGRVEWDGKYLRLDWSHYWWYDGKEKPIKWWNSGTVTGMSETGHHRTWLHPLMLKPWRARCKQLQREIRVGHVDPDEALFPIYGRPWIYYW